MKKNGKIISFILLITLFASIITGCHRKKEMKGFAVPEDFDMDARYEITFWAKNDTNKSQVKVYEQAIKDFEELYPNIKVNISLYTDYNTIYNDVITNIATGTTPNVCVTYPDHIATYMTGGDTVVPLDTLFDDKEYGLGGSRVRFDSVKKDEIVPEFLEECRLNGQHYCIPFMRSTEVCYINKTYVEKLGYELPEVLTWDFVFEVSEAAMAKDEDGNFAVNGQQVLIPFIYKSTDNMMIQMLKQKGAGYSNDNGEILIFNDTTKELLLEIAKHGKTKAFSTFKISSYPANFLNAGQCIFAIDSTAGSTWMGTNAPLRDISDDKLVDFETEVMMIPQFDTENSKMVSQGPSICIFNKEDSGEVMASWLFAQYLLTNDVQNAYSMTEGYCPVTTKAQQSEEYGDYLSKAGTDDKEHYEVKIKASKLLMENTVNTFVTPVFNGSTSLRNAAGQMIENVVKSVRRKETVDDAYLDKLFKDVTALYRLDSIGVTSEDDFNKNLGPLPKEAKILLISLGVVWLMIATVFIRGLIAKRKKSVA